MIGVRALVSLSTVWIYIAPIAAQPACTPEPSCLSCLTFGESCLWCDTLGICVPRNSGGFNFTGWEEHNCSTTALDSSGLCPEDSLLTGANGTETNTTKMRNSTSFDDDQPVEKSDESACISETTCRGCVNAAVSCQWCEALGVCVTSGEVTINITEWESHNCSKTAFNASEVCPPELILTTEMTETTEKKLKCAAIGGVFVEEDCDVSVLTKDDKGNPIMAFYPLISAIAGVLTFLIMLFVWIKFFYHQNKRPMADGLSEPITVSTEVDNGVNEFSKLQSHA